MHSIIHAQHKKSNLKYRFCSIRAISVYNVFMSYLGIKFFINSSIEINYGFENSLSVSRLTESLRVARACCSGCKRHHVTICNTDLYKKQRNVKKDVDVVVI